MAQSFHQLLQKKWNDGKFVCVGLDPVYDKLPKFIHEKFDNVADQIFYFNQEIIDATAHIVCAFKPNIAFYEAEDEEGMKALRATLEYLQKNYPDVPVILDAKRGDIGKTNLGYVKAYFDEMGVDALTVSPYLGKDALQPLLDRKEKGIIVLVRTSNDGAAEMQDLFVDTGKGLKMPYYEYVASQVAEKWNDHGNCAVVAGGTYPDQLARIRIIIGDMPMLIPGIGAQGGNVEEVVKAGLNSKKQGIIINSSSAILYASAGDDFAEAAAQEAQRLHTEITHFI